MIVPQTFDEIVDEISRFTEQDRAEVAHRVWMEAMDKGWNVLRDVEQFGVTPRHFDDRMQRLYRDGSGFIFESLVFGSTDARRRWTELACERLSLYAHASSKSPDSLDILMLGDGNGTDSLVLVERGFKVDYFEVPDSKTFEFAKRRFEHYGALPHKVRMLDAYESCFDKLYDAVVSFEVLEHLPEPQRAIREIGRMLKPGGLALVSEDFGNLAGYLPTHLARWAKYLGRTPFLFLKENMRLTWYSREQLFKPYQFVKVKQASFSDWVSLWADPNVRGRIFSRFTGRLKCLRARSFEITD